MPTFPPGSANALAASSANTALSQPVPRTCAGSAATRLLTMQRTYAAWRASPVCFFCALSSAKDLAPSWLSCACETAPTYWVRPVGDVVVAQPATVATMASDSSRCFIGRLLGDPEVVVCRA